MFKYWEYEFKKLQQSYNWNFLWGAIWNLLLIAKLSVKCEYDKRQNQFESIIICICIEKLYTFLITRRTRIFFDAKKPGKTLVIEIIAIYYEVYDLL